MVIRFQYAVKFICGASNGKILAPGRYWTAINVHNPSYSGVRFRKKFAVAYPNERPGPVTDFFPAQLGPDQAFEIDCEDIRQHTGLGEEFLKGFVVIESDTELDIVAVYTAAGAEERVSTLDVERVFGRRMEIGLPDLIPVPDANGSFCRRNEQGQLIVTVRNQGTAGAGPSTTRVDFGAFGTALVPTPPLAPGASVDLTVPIPFGCFNPDCEFRITVDADSVVAESDEGNNTASGICIG